MLHMCTEGFGQLGIVGTFPHCITYGTTVKHTPNEKKRNRKSRAMYIVETNMGIIQTNT